MNRLEYDLMKEVQLYGEKANCFNRRRDCWTCDG